MYTEFFFRAEIKAEEQDVQRWLKRIVDLDTDSPFDDHRFFALPRWRAVFGCSSAYFPTRGSLFEKPSYCNAPELFIHSSLKNYDDEIEAFMDWVKPWLDAYPGDFLGYSLYEESRGDDDRETPTLLFMT